MAKRKTASRADIQSQVETRPPDRELQHAESCSHAVSCTAVDTYLISHSMMLLTEYKRLSKKNSSSV